VDWIRLAQYGEAVSCEHENELLNCVKGGEYLS